MSFDNTIGNMVGNMVGSMIGSMVGSILGSMLGNMKTLVVYMQKTMHPLKSLKRKDLLCFCVYNYSAYPSNKYSPLSTSASGPFSTSGMIGLARIYGS